MEPRGLLPCSQKPTTGLYHKQVKSASLKSCVTFCNVLVPSVRRWWLPPNPQDGGPPLISRSQLHIQYNLQLSLTSTGCPIHTQHKDMPY